MTKTADIGSKRLIGLAPDTWVRWLTGDPTTEALDFPSGEFEWVARSTDVLLKARSPRHGTFLIANEIQFRPDERMSRRIRAYAALAEERYGLNVYPAVVNILPPKPPDAAIPDSYHSEFMGLMAHQDYAVLNLWELDASLVLDQHWTTLLPFVPILRGGDDKAIVSKALAQLRADDRLTDMETFLAFWATFVLTLDEVRIMMRWDMAMLRESPWYNAILEEGLDLGLQRGRQEGWQEGRQEGRQEGMYEERIEMALRILNRRFGDVPPELIFRIRGLGAEQLLRLVDAALMAPSLEVIATSLVSLSPTRGAEDGDYSPA